MYSPSHAAKKKKCRSETQIVMQIETTQVIQQPSASQHHDSTTNITRPGKFVKPYTRPEFYLYRKYTTYPNHIVRDVTTYIISMVTTLRAEPSGVQMLVGATDISLIPNAGTGAVGTSNLLFKTPGSFPGGRAIGQ